MTHTWAQVAQTCVYVVTGAILIGALLIQILVPILAIRWLQRPFIGVLLTHDLIVTDIHTGRTGTTPILQPAGRLTAVDGHRVYTSAGLADVLDNYSFGESVLLTVEWPSRSGRPIILNRQVVLHRFPMAALIRWLVVPYVTGLGYLCVSIGAYLRSRSSSVRPRRVSSPHGRRPWIAFCALVSIALSALFEVHTTHLLDSFWVLALPLASVFLIYWGATFFVPAGLQRTPIGRRWTLSGILRSRRFFLLLLALALPFIVWGQVTLYALGLHASHLAWLPGAGFAAAGIVAFSGFLVSRAAQTTARGIQTILAGTVAAVAPTFLWAISLLIDRSFPDVIQPYTFEPLINLPALLLLPLSVVATTRRGTGAGRGWFTAGPLSRKGQIPAAGLRSNGAYLRSDGAYLRSTSYSEIIRHLARDLAASMDTEFIIAKLLSCIGQVLQPTHALAFLISTDDTYRLHRIWGDADLQVLQNVRFTHHDGLIVHLQRDGESVDVKELQLETVEHLRLEQLDASLAVPLRSKDHLMGVLIIGPSNSGEGYTADDMALLNTIADQATVAAENALLYAQQLEQEQRLLQQTRRLTDILALGNQLKSLDHELVVKSTVQAVHDRLKFGLVTLSLVEEEDPTRVRVVAWDGIESAAWERLALTSFPLINLQAMEGMHKIENCYFVFAPGTTPAVSTSLHTEPWTEGDQLFVPLTASDELLGYLTIDQPEDGRRPTEDTLEVLEIFANQAAVAIQNANLYASIDHALDDRVAELATLHEIDTQLNVKLDFDYVMNVTLEWAMRITHAIAGTLALSSPDGKSLHIVAHKGYPAELDRYWSTPWPINEGIMGRVIRSGEPEMIEDVAKNVDYPGVEGAPRCHLAAPIKREGRISGVISLESDQPSGFTVDDLAFLMRFADHAAVVVENVRLYEETSRRVAELSALQQISLDLTSSLNLNAVLESVAQNTMALTRADGTTIYLYDEHEEALFFGTGLSKQGSQERPPIPIPEDALTMTVARRGTPAVVHDTQDTRSWPAEFTTWDVTNPNLLAEWEIGAIASIPLQKAGHVLGVFDVVFRQPHFFSPDELRALNLLADQAAIAVQNAQLFLEVQRANEAKTEFVSIVSHELKVPMTSIQGYARLITLGSAGPVTPQQMEFTNVILRNVDRMSSLVNDLLDLSRIESGRIQITPRPVDLSKLVQDAARALQDQLEQRAHTLEIAIPADLPNVEADPVRIVQVWVNLLSNAFKYTPRGGRIKVWAREHSSRESKDNDDRWILCAVQDNGVGIEAKDQERIFEQFYRVNHPETKAEQGTGLGLSITRSIVELHGGHIWVESMPGRGSTFYFTLRAV